MAKSLKGANWGTGGCMCFIVAGFTFASFLLTGGASSPHGHKVKGLGALLGSAFMFLLGLISVGVWLALKLTRGRQRGPGGRMGRVVRGRMRQGRGR